MSLKVLLPWLLAATTAVSGESARVVRMAKLQIDPAQLSSYRTALKEEIADSIRLEPGVLSLYAVAEKKDPTRITIIEEYADQAAYEAHISTPHFLKYKVGTQNMVQGLELMETDPILLGGKHR